jgi:hypothetical protein
MIDVLVIVAKALAQRIQAALGAVEVEASPALGALSTVLSDFLDLIGNVTELAKELAAPPTLPKPIEEKWGVSAAAVAVAASGAGGAAAEEKTTFTVELTAAGEQKVAVHQVPRCYQDR